MPNDTVTPFKPKKTKEAKFPDVVYVIEWESAWGKPMLLAGETLEDLPVHPDSVPCAVYRRSNVRNYRTRRELHD